MAEPAQPSAQPSAHSPAVARPDASGGLPLAGLFNPQSVVVIGASDDPEKIAGRPLGAMRQCGFAGPVYAINAKRDIVQGEKAYPDLASLPQVPELAIVCVPSAAAVQAVHDCAKAGVRYAVVFAGGFAETGEAGRQLQLQLTAAAQGSGLRILGPNCLGVMDFRSKLFATFTKAIDEDAAQHAQGLAVVSQSGALGNYMLTQASDQGIAITKWVATGNEADIEFAEVIEALVHDPAVTGILTYLEGARDGPRLRRALQAARANRVPVAIIKVGATDIGAQAVVSHTDALAGDDAVYDALFRECGVHRVHGVQELLDLGNAIAQARPVSGNKILLATISGGVGVIMAEAAERAGLVLPSLSEQTRSELKKALPFMSPSNPLDVTGQVVQNFALLETAIELGLRDTGAHLAVCFIGRMARQPATLAQYEQTISNLRALYSDAVFITVGMFDPATSKRLQANGQLVYSDPTRAITAASALAAFGASFARSLPQLPASDVVASYVRPRPTGPLNEAQAYDLLADIGIAVPDYAIATSAAQATQAWQGMRAPVVMKVLSPDVAHKSDLGGVRLNLNDPANIAVAFDAIMHRVAQAMPSARIDGVLLAPMTPVAAEVVLGARIDAQLGPVVMVGAGGILVELLDDVVVHSAPVSVATATEMIKQLKSARLLGEWRGRAALDIEAVARALAHLSCFVAANAHWLQSIEINPLVPGAQGQGAIALDCALQLQSE